MIEGFTYYTKAEYTVIWAIVTTSVFFGSFASIGIGFALAIVIFLVRYSNSPFVRLIRNPELHGVVGWSHSVSQYVHQHRYVSHSVISCI